MYMDTNHKESQCWRAGARLRVFLEGAGAGKRNYQIGSQEPEAGTMEPIARTF